MARLTISSTKRLNSFISVLRSRIISSLSFSSMDFAFAKSSMFVLTLVRGVRSSWLASVTSLFCWSRDVASARNITLKLSAKRRTSLSPSFESMKAVSSWVRATCSAVLDNLLMGFAS